MNVNYSSTYDPMCSILLVAGESTNLCGMKKGKLFRRTNTSWKFGVNLSFTDQDWKEMYQSDEGTEAETGTNQPKPCTVYPLG
ncbi:MAG: hypothetical protein U5L09_17745 [Bacteroidales bacterium]|nr:hypothetical protein [Bacteroidales bacterium]